MNLPNRRLFDTFKARVALAKVFRQYKPKVVIGFGGKTVLASPDHYQAMQITDAAVFYSRLTKWDEHFDGLPVHTINNQLSFVISHARSGFTPGLGVHRGRYRQYAEGKAGRRSCLCDAVPGDEGGDLQRIETMNRYHGLTAGFEAGELFMTHRTVGVDDLMRWASPVHAQDVMASRTCGMGA